LTRAYPTFISWLHLCPNLCSTISAHVFGVKQNVHVLVVVHGVGSAGALPALGSARVAARGWRSRRRRSLSLGHAGQGAMVRSSLPCSCSSGVRGLSRFDVAQFRFRGDAVSATRAAPAWGCARARLALADPSP